MFTPSILELVLLVMLCACRLKYSLQYHWLRPLPELQTLPLVPFTPSQ